MIDSTQLINFRPGKDGDVPFESNVIIDKRKNWAIGFWLLAKGWTNWIDGWLVDYYFWLFVQSF